MYIKIDFVREAVAELEYIHPFYGITYLVCKKAKLSVGEAIQFSMETTETDFLDKYFKPYPDSDFFFRLFRVSDKLKLWVHRTKYASSTLQSIRTRSAFSEAFIHERNTAEWGWTVDYQGVLRASLSFNAKQYKKNRIPGFILACWLYRDVDWHLGSTALDILQRFETEFSIDESDSGIFDLSLPNSVIDEEIFQARPISREELQELFGDPPDSIPEKGEILSLLEIQDVGPLSHLHFEPAERLNLITGDNGLGKSFLMECAWWAITGEWESRSRQATPKFSPDVRPTIAFQIKGQNKKLEKVVSSFNTPTQNWSFKGSSRPTIDGLAIYGRVDGSFAVWNPIRQTMLRENVNRRDDLGESRVLNISSQEVWDGIPGQFEGLLRDWIEWQNISDIENPDGAFETLKRVLVRLSPADLGTLEPGEPVRLPFESRRIPTIKHRYGEVPIIYESAAVRRVLALAYLLVWTWNEHLVYSNLSNSLVQRRMVVLIDEIEAHLHPLWQRKVLPALLDYSDDLPLELQTQFFIATHSPLVMASAETIFNQKTDGLFHLDLTNEGQVNFSEMEFVRQGTVDAWLTSKVFDLRHARSLAADEAIEKGKMLQKEKVVDPNLVKKISEDLIKTLAADDEFWPRWIYFAEKFGVTI